MHVSLACNSAIFCLNLADANSRMPFHQCLTLTFRFLRLPLATEEGSLSSSNGQESFSLLRNAAISLIGWDGSGHCRCQLPFRQDGSCCLTRRLWLAEIVPPPCAPEAPGGIIARGAGSAKPSTPWPPGSWVCSIEP